MAVTTQQVQALYIAYFNRPGDFLGLPFQVAQANKNGLQAVADSFAKSAEYIATYAGKGTAEIIDTVYLNLFGRHAEPAGIAYWGGKLTSGELTLGNIALQIFNGAQNADLVAINSKLAAADAFYAALDTNAEIVGYDGIAANNVVKAWMAGIVDPATLDASTSVAALLTVTTAAVAAHDAVSNVGQTIELTVGIDKFAGGSGNDTVNALIDASVSSLDDLDGGLGNDVLNVNHSGAGTLSMSTFANIKGFETINLVSAANIGVGVAPGVTAQDLSAIAGVNTIHASAVGTANVKAAATTDVVMTAVGNGTVEGGKDVVATSTTGDLVIDGTTHSVTATTAVGDVTVSASKGAVIINSANDATTTGAKSTVTVTADGNVSIGGGTVVKSTITNVSASQNTADLAAQVTAGTDLTAANTAVTTATTAATAAAAAVTALATMKAAILAATDITTFDAAIDAGVTAGAITGTAGAGYSAQELALHTGFAAGLAVTGTAAVQMAAAQKNALDLYTGYIATAATTNTTAIATLATAVATAAAASDAKDAIDAIVLDEVLYTHAATTNTALTAATFSTGDTVTVADASTANNTLTTVTLNNTGVASLTGQGITTVNLNANGNNVTVVNTAAHTETFNVDAVTASTLQDANATAVVVNAATASAFTLSAAAATSMTLGGAGKITATLTAGNVAAATVTGAGGLSADLTGLKATAVVTATASSGTNTVKVGATQSYLGGSGVDTVTLAALPTKAVTGGAGAADEVAVGYAGGFDGTVLTNVTGFEVLGASTAALGTFNATGFTKLHVGGGTLGGAVVFNNIAAGTALNVDGIAGAVTTYTLKDATSTTSDAMTLNLGLATKAGFAASAVDTSGVEIVTINSAAKSGANTISITDADALTLNVVATGGTATISGFAGLTLTKVDMTGSLKSVNVSGVGVSAAGATFIAGAGGSTITGGTGNDTITGGAGVDTIHGGTGADVIVGGGGKDVIWGDAGADKITLSGTTSTLKYLAGDTGVNTSTTFQTAELTTTLDVVYGAAAGTKFDLSNIYTGADAAHSLFDSDLVRAAANLAGADNDVVIARGTYDAANGTFTYALTGLDSVITFDTDTTGGTAFQSAVLVGFVATASTTLISGVVTL